MRSSISAWPARQRGNLRLEGKTSGYVQLSPSAAAGSWTLTLPTGVPASNGYVLSSTTAGVTSWVANGGNPSLSSITSATATNTINSTNFAQTWQWNSLTTQTAFTLSSSSLTNGKILSLQNTAAAATATGHVLDISNTTTGAGYGVYSAMTGHGNTGYAGYFANTSTTGANYGVYGTAASSSGYGGYFSNTSTGWALNATGTSYFNGNVGIGTTSPSYPLSISTSSVAFTPELALYNTSTGTQSYVQMGYISGEVWSTGVGVPTETVFGVPNKFFLFDATAGAFRLVVDTGGNVGIGTTAPTAKLHIYDTGGANGALDNVMWLTGGGTGNAGPAMVFNDYYGDGSYPTWQLAQVGAAYDSGSSWGGDLHIILNTGDTATSTTERMTIVGATGSVGIGTTTPDSGAFYTYGGTVNKVLALGSTTSGDQLQVTMGVIDGTKNQRAGMFLEDTGDIWGLRGNLQHRRIPNFCYKKQRQ